MAESYLFYSSERMLTLIEREDKLSSVSDVVIAAESELTGHTHEEIFHNSIDRLKVMKRSVDKGMEVERSRSGMVRDEAKKLFDQHSADTMMLSPLVLKAASWGLSVMACNAVMGTIVAAPTAGSSGIIPGSLLALQEEKGYSDEQTARGLLASAGIGMVIAHISTFSAAKAGCQAEVGASSAMAAAAISEMRGLSAEQCVHAAALALQNLLGLACDPIAGLVEVPCVVRNAFGINHAFMASDLAAAGVKSVVPFDEVVEAMNNVAKNMSPALRETSTGGLAVSKTAKRIVQELVNIQP